MGTPEVRPTNRKLAIFGGNPSVSIRHPRKWPFVSEKSAMRVCNLMNDGHLFEFERGKITQEIEEKIGNYFGSEYTLVTSSGTSALHSAFVSIGIAPGDEVIVPTYTFHATATPLFLCGATPVLCDSEARTGNIDPEKIIECITENTKAIVVTHMWGHPADMNRISSIAASRGIYVVEDASHAVGSLYYGRKAGVLADVAAVSLGGAKMVTGGMGGVLLTANREIFERAVLLGHSHERARNSELREPYHSIADAGFGANYRMSVIASALCIDQFDSLDDRIKVKTENFNTLSIALEQSGLLQAPICLPECTRGGWYGYKAFYSPEKSFGISLDVVIEALQAEGLKVSKPKTKPLHQLYAFSGDRIELAQYDYLVDRRVEVNRRENFPVADKLYDTVVGFPDAYFHEKNSEILNMYVDGIFKVANSIEQLRELSP